PTALLSLYNASTDKGRQGAQADLTALRDILESIPGKMIAVQKLLLHHLGVTAMVSPVRQRERELSNNEQGEILRRLAEIPGKLNRNPQIQSQIKEIFTRR
ncbi:MAG: hypothetical protein KAU50_10325, partial [Candidatus Marinimicrobia bacterium]|nr:hypothetical protein [Candidatus Neomarinimicrobiota bacterium]